MLRSFLKHLAGSNPLAPRFGVGLLRFCRLIRLVRVVKVFRLRRGPCLWTIWSQKDGWLSMKLEILDSVIQYGFQAVKRTFNDFQQETSLLFGFWLIFELNRSFLPINFLPAVGVQFLSAKDCAEVLFKEALDFCRCMKELRLMVKGCYGCRWCCLTDFMKPQCCRRP